MWMPTWLGMNKEVKDVIEKELAPLLIGKEATEELLDAVNDQLLALLERRYSTIRGLRDYLDGIKFIQI